MLDSAHGHSENVLKCARMIKDAYPNLPLIGGNVATGEGTKALIEAGVRDMDLVMAFTGSDDWRVTDE